MKDKAKALLVIIFIIIAALTVMWQSKSQMLMAAFGNTLSTELTQAIGTTVGMDSVEIGTFGSITVHGLVLSDRNQQTILTAEKAIVGFNPFKMIIGQSAEAAVSNIKIINPHVTLTQAADGRWSIEELLESRNNGNSALNLQLSIVSGTANIRNSNSEWLLENIQGTIAVEQQLVTAIQLELTHAGASADIKGFWNSTRGALEVKARNIQLAHYQSLIPADRSIQLLSGTAPVAEVILSHSNSQITYAGEAQIENGALIVDDLPISDLQGLITFTDSNLYLFNQAKVFNQPINVRGQITTNTTNPVLNLAVASTGFDLTALNPTFPIHGVTAFEATVTGATDNPSVSGQFKLQQAQFNGLSMENIALDLSYQNKMLTINDLKGQFLNGQVSIKGQVIPETLQYTLHIQGSQLDSAMLADVLPGLSGDADLDIVASGGQDIANAVIYGTAAIHSGQVQGLGFDNLNTSFYKDGPSIVLDYVNIGVGSGVVTANGTINANNLNLAVQGNGLPLNRLAQLEPRLKLEGMADFKGIISGTTSQPRFQADFTAVNGQAFYQPFTQATGKMVVLQDRLVLQDVVLVDGMTRHALNGWIGIHDNHLINLNLVSRQARAENLIKLLAPGEKLTGNVDNDVMITGSLNNIQAEGNILLTEGSFRGFLIARGAGHYQQVNGTTVLKDFAINSLNTQVKIGGSIQPDNQMDLDIAAKDVDIARLHVNFPYPIAGQANFSGKLRGTPDYPIFNGELTADHLVFNSQPLQQVAGTLNIQGNQIDIPVFGFSQGSGKFIFSGGINLASNEVYGDLAVENGQLAALLSVLNTPVKGVDGQLNGRITISGNTIRPNVELTGNLKKGNIKKYPLDNIELDIALSNNIVTVRNFTAQQGQGILAVHGSADLNGPLQLEVGGRDIDAGLITNWFDSDVETKGKLNFAAQVSGTADDPKAAVSLEIAGGGVANATFDSLYGLLLLDQGSIHVNQLLLTKGAYRASAYGVIPVAALTSQGRQQAAVEDQMDIKVRLDEADLSIMPLLTKEVSWAVGRTQGELTIGGTLAQPTLNGNVSVKDGVVKLASLADPIQKVGLDIRFNGDKIDLKTFEGFMGSGSYHLTGSAKLNGLALRDYDFSLKMDNLGVNSKYFKGPLNGELTLISGTRRPKLAGKLIVENATIDIPYIPEMTTESPNIALDVEVVAGKKVRLYNPYMYDIWAEGRVKFAGTTHRPDVSGRIDATRGTISYLRTSFKIREASAEFTQFASFEPIIKLNAETRLSQTRIFIAANGPASAMGLQLTSEPSMSQQEILSLLTLRSRYFDKQNGTADDRDSGLGRDELVALLDAGLQLRFISELESTFRDVFGLDEFRLVRDTLSGVDNKSGNDAVRDREVYNIEFGKYLTDRFMLNYTMGVGHDDENGIGFRYDLTRSMSITGSYDKLNRQRIGIETRFKF
jgi:translocation and assembly module TamB